MSRYQKQIALTQQGSGYQLTLTETVGDNDPIVTTIDFATAAELKTYTDAQLDKAIAEQTLYETLAKKAEGEQRAWFKALNDVSQNDYFINKRVEIKNWLDEFNFRYSNSAGQIPVDCAINSNWFVRGIKDNKNYLRLSFDSKRRISARVVGSQTSFDMLSADEEWWVGTDENNITHRLRKIKKNDR